MDIYAITDEEGKEILNENGVSDLLLKGMSTEIQPKWNDLARLFVLVRERKPFQILEFGSGFSTIVMGCALKKNWSDYLEIIARSAEGQPRFDPPKLISLESSEEWMDNTMQKVYNSDLLQFCDIHFSTISISEYQGQLCHFYDKLPNIVPDFVYLDGPDPSSVMGNINGLSFNNPHRTVMSGDILKYESTLCPGFFMIIDGRTNNARFLKRMMTREYLVHYSNAADVTTFEMTEFRLGRKNVYGWEAYNGKC